MADEEFRREVEALLTALGQKVRVLREATGLSQGEFAKRLKIHRTEVGSIDVASVSRACPLLILADGLGVEVGELVEGLPAPLTRRTQPTQRRNGETRIDESER